MTPDEKRFIDANLRDTEIVFGEVHRLLQKDSLSSKDQIDLLACVDLQTQSIKRLTILINSLDRNNQFKTQ